LGRSENGREQGRESGTDVWDRKGGEGRGGEGRA